MMRNALVALALLLSANAAAQEFGVRYRSQNNVYLDAGTASGIAVGERFEVVRDGKVIANVEVIFAAERSASCRIVNESTPVREGDRVRRVGAPAAPRRETPPPPASPPAPIYTPATSWSPSLSGSVSVDFEQNDRDSSRALGRLSLRARNFGPIPLQLRTRMRAASDNRTRLYELSLMYEPRDFRIGVRAGRIGNSPFIGLGYLDGALVRARIIDGFEAGAFAGYRPDPEDLSFDTSTTKFGGYLRAGGDAETRRPWDIIVAAVQQQGENDQSGSYVAVDGRYAATDRLSLFAHGRAGSADSEDSRFDTMLALVYRAAANQSLTVAYERVEPDVDDDLRTTGQRVDDFLRQGFRVTWTGGWFTLGGGLRSGESSGTTTGNTTYSANAGLTYPNIAGRGFFAGLNATGFSSPLTDGVFVHARAGKRLAAGHSLELSAGALVTDEPALDEIEQSVWLRGAAWLELPADLFGRAEYELNLGDSHTGNRATIGLGYRF